MHIYSISSGKKKPFEHFKHIFRNEKSGQRDKVKDFKTFQKRSSIKDDTWEEGKLKASSTCLVDFLVGFLFLLGEDVYNYKGRNYQQTKILSESRKPTG